MKEGSSLILDCPYSCFDRMLLEAREDVLLRSIDADTNGAGEGVRVILDAGSDPEGGRGAGGGSLERKGLIEVLKDIAALPGVLRAEELGEAAILMAEMLLGQEGIPEDPVRLLISGEPLHDEEAHRLESGLGVATE